MTTAKGSSNLKQETYSYYADGNRSSYTSFAGNTVTTAYEGTAPRSDTNATRMDVVLRGVAGRR